MSAPFIQARQHGGGGNIPPTRIVIHCTVSPTERGGARSIARYFATTTNYASAHYVVDPAEVVQCLREDAIGYHAPPNAHSIGVELCDPQKGSTSRWGDADHDAMLRLAAPLVRDVAKRYGIPLVRIGPADLRAGRKGICGHVDVTNAWHQTTHVDPGDGFPWDYFLALVNGEDDDDMQLTDLVEVKNPDGTLEKIPIAFLFNRMNYAYEQARATPALVKSVATLVANDAAQTKLLSLLQSRPDVDPAVIRSAVDAAVKAALDDYTLSLTHNPEA